MSRTIPRLVALSLAGLALTPIANAEVLACKSRTKLTDTRIITGSKCPKGFRQLAALAESSEITGLSLKTSTVSENHEAEPKATTTFAIECPAGETAVSGGFSISPETVSHHDSPDSVQAQAFQPVLDADGQSIGWSVTFLSSSAQARAVVVYAVCSSLR